jgi:hypothetical protein
MALNKTEFYEAHRIGEMAAIVAGYIFRAAHDEFDPLMHIGNKCMACGRNIGVKDVGPIYHGCPFCGCELPLQPIMRRNGTVLRGLKIDHLKASIEEIAHTLLDKEAEHNTTGWGEATKKSGAWAKASIDARLGTNLSKIP